MDSPGEEHLTPILETLEELAGLVNSGLIRHIVLIRHIGLSNEIPWGVMQFLHYAETVALLQASLPS